MKVKKHFVALKAAIITAFLFIFVSLAFVAMNESQRLLNGDAISVYLKENSINISKGEVGYCIEPDLNLIRSFVNFSHKHPAVVPFPFQFMVHSRALIYELIEQIMEG